MSGRRSVVAALAAVVALFGSGLSALMVRAEPAPTGRQVALGLEEACPEKTEVLVAADFERREVFGRWVTVAGPTFGLDPAAPRPGLTGHTVDPGDPRRLFVTEGSVIARSLDGGCSWNEVHFVPPPAGSDLTQQYATGSIIQLAVSGTGATSRVWALWAPQANTVGAIRLFVSDDGGDSWEERSEGLPPAYYKPTDLGPGVGVAVRLDCSGPSCQKTEMMSVASDNSDVAYIGLSGSGPQPTFFSTTNGGQNWVGSPLPRTYGCCGVGITDLAVDPADSASVWFVEAGALNHSPDGGRTFTQVRVVETFNATVAGLHLSRHAGPELNVSVLIDYPDESQVLTFDSMARSTDGGKTFDEQELAELISGVPAVAQGGDPASLLLTTASPDQVLQYRDSERRALSLAVDRLGRASDPVRDTTADSAVWVRGFAQLAAFVPGPLPGGRFPPRPRFDPVAGRLADRPPVPGDLHPATLERDLGPGGSQTVDYRLELPSLPTPVDIWFLVDTSSSMSGAHRGLQTGIRDIAAQLRALGLDAWYGVAVFPDGGSIPYGRYADLGPAGGELYDALDRLGPHGGGNELHPTALYQSVTGAGQPDAELPAGLGASFRPEALKIIIHASDEPYGFDPNGPTKEEAGEALVAAGVRHVGLDLTDGATLPGAAGLVSGLRRDHDDMAIVTDTYAPPGGVDCNGDGRLELEEGDPLTCPINRVTDSIDIAPTIVAAVSAVRDDTAVSLTVADAGGIGVEIADPTRTPVNVKVPNSLPFSVRFTCPPEMTGKVGEVVLRATVRGAPSAEGVARIACGTPPVQPAPPRLRPPTPAPIVPMVIAPPQVVPDLEPAISPLSQTAPAQVAQPTPQPGLAAQPGEVATAKQRAGRNGPPPPSVATGDSGQRNSAPATAGTLGAGAALSVALGGWAVRRERRPAVATARA